MNYKKAYENYYGIIVPDDFEIHHIDYNHGNNAMNNLVALPKELHRKLHETKRSLDMFKSNFTVDDIIVHSGKITAKTEFIQMLYRHLFVIELCTEYVNKRDFSRGLNDKDEF